MGFHLSLVAIASIMDCYSNFTASSFSIAAGDCFVYFLCDTSPCLNASRSSSSEIHQKLVVILLFALFEFAARTVIHSFLLWVFSSGELLRLETRLIRTVGRGGEGAGGGSRRP